MITAMDFATVRSYLEDFGDLSILADIIGIVATSLDGKVLTCAADTLLYHEKAFKAIGAFEPLFGKIAMRYAVIRTVRSPERELLLSLTDLSVAAKADNHLFQALGHDLGLSEQKNSVAACSPASDTTAEVVCKSRVSSDEEIDRVLASGTTMDQQVMTRMVDKVLVNLEDQVQKASLPTGNHGVWFYRLRAFDENTFESILVDRLIDLLTSHRTILSRALLPVLVTSRCVTLSLYLKVARDCISKRKSVDDEDALGISMDVIDVLLPSEQLNPLCQPQEAYRYRLEQWKFLDSSGASMLQLIGQTLELGVGPLSPTSQAQLSQLLTNDRVHGAVRHFVLKDVQSLCSSLGIGTRSYSDATRRALKNLVDNLLDPSDSLCKCPSFLLHHHIAHAHDSFVSEEHRATDQISR
jgi:mediator of RNA polymerase II transcription subunit 12